MITLKSVPYLANNMVCEAGGDNLENEQQFVAVQP